MTMFKKILIANRGEISCRVTRTAHRLGVRTVAVYSDADAAAMHVEMADEAVRLGPAPSRESYLCIDKIIAAARSTGAEAIHPGYGFLSENAEFARTCREAGLAFIGPSPEAIVAMGSKSGAKALMEKAGVPLVPGYHGEEQDDAFLLARAHEIGFPVLLKASAGGGGKGMRAVHHESEFFESLSGAQREAQNAFGDQRMLIEKLLVEPRHVEVQVMADRHGNAVYVFDRDCSIQRRHQKVVEEAPAPGLTPELREAMGNAAVRAAKAIAYEGAGTLEFLVDKNGNFYFMEMNTRLQVEHPVSELVSGLDLVEWQLRVASGEPLTFSQAALKTTGHAIEVRLYAEDPESGFLPSTGALRHFAMPAGEGIRVDTGYRTGDNVSVYYDPMMAKVIAWGETRTIAAERLADALRKTCIAGVKHNTGFLVRVLSHPAFLSGQLSTHFIDDHQEALFAPSASDRTALFLLGALHTMQTPHATTNSNDTCSPWSRLQGFRIAHHDASTLRVQIGSETEAVTLTPAGESHDYRIGDQQGNCSMVTKSDRACLIRDGHLTNFRVVNHGQGLDVFSHGEHSEISIATHSQTSESAQDDRHYSAPMNGRIVSVNVGRGDAVKQGDTLLVMEAMKMEHRIRAHGDGVIASIDVSSGDLVSEGQVLVAIETGDHGNE